jgi:Holliday junction resolvase RusA-like endonuclease
MTAPRTRIVVRGHPAPQGSKRHVGNGVMIESSKHVRPWREAVKAAALDVITTYPDYAHLGPGYPLDGPLVAIVFFTFARPKNHYRTGRNAHLLRDDAPPGPIGKPDLSKLLRSTEDALTDAGVWHDDARVIAYKSLAKVYAAPDAGPYILDSPGAVIEVWPLIPGTETGRGTP